VPPGGQTLLIVGQTLGGINEHVASFPDEPTAGGWAAYWGVPSMDGVDQHLHRARSGASRTISELVDTLPEHRAPERDVDGRHLGRRA
jgi:hypothetical protein